MKRNTIKSIEWTGNSLKIIDQTELPRKFVYRDLKRVEEVYEAIQKLRVRGAPAIGVAAAFGLYLGLNTAEVSIIKEPMEQLLKISDYLVKSRPTAVNLQWSLQSIIQRVKEHQPSHSDIKDFVLKQAKQILKDDEERCLHIAEQGYSLIKNNMTILTHCNTGALATAGIGTALGIIKTANDRGKRIRVFVDETRPLLQGARLTMWELKQNNIPATLISDNMAAFAMQKGDIDLVLVGADRIAANGDVANKIGTYNLAVSAAYHQLPFYVAAPLSTFDFSLTSGQEIPIEERNGDEITNIWNRLNITTAEAETWNPAFDVTPGSLITGIITEREILNQPFEQKIKKLNYGSYKNMEEENL
jgi:methylthioribose-1-phosphate isomerase